MNRITKQDLQNAADILAQSLGGSTDRENTPLNIPLYGVTNAGGYGDGPRYRFVKFVSGENKTTRWCENDTLFEGLSTNSASEFHSKLWFAIRAIEEYKRNHERI